MSQAGGKRRSPQAALQREIDAFTAALQNAVAGGGGVTELARVASRALKASVGVFSEDGSPLAFAGATPADEKQLLSGGAHGLDLVVEGRLIGALRFKPRDDQPPDYLVQMLVSFISLEVDRTHAGLSERAIAGRRLVQGLLDNSLTDELDEYLTTVGFDPRRPLKVLVARLRLQSPQPEDWQQRSESILRRAAAATTAKVFLTVVDSYAYCLFDTADAEVVAAALSKVAASDLKGLELHIGLTRPAENFDQLRTVLFQAQLSANRAFAAQQALVAYPGGGLDDLLVVLLAQGPKQLDRFVQQSIGPLIAYEQQYRTGLIATMTKYLELDGKIEATAKALFTHRHTIRYRLERINKLSGLDVSTSAGREQLSIGLQAAAALGYQLPNAAEAEVESAADGELQ